MSYKQVIVEGIESLPTPDELLRLFRTIIKVNDKFGESKTPDDVWFLNEGLSTIPDAIHYHKGDGGGNDLDVVFLNDGSCLIYGFDHETVEATTEDIQPVFNGLTKKFDKVLDEPDLMWGDRLYASLAFWYDADDEDWFYNTSYVNSEYQFDDGGFNYFFEDIINFNIENYVTKFIYNYELDESVKDDIIKFMKAELKE